MKPRGASLSGVTTVVTSQNRSQRSSDGVLLKSKPRWIRSIRFSIKERAICSRTHDSTQEQTNSTASRHNKPNFRLLRMRPTPLSLGQPQRPHDVNRSCLGPRPHERIVPTKESSPTREAYRFRES